MSTKNNPGGFDCYTKAAPDEEMFILLSRDIAAPAAVLAWCHTRVTTLERNTWDDDQITEALECARRMLRQQAPFPELADEAIAHFNETLAELKLGELPCPHHRHVMLSLHQRCPVCVSMT